MPLNGDALAAVIKAARESASASFMADKQGRALSPSEMNALMETVDKATWTAFVLYFTTNAMVVGTAAGVTSGPSAAPVTGLIT